MARYSDTKGYVYAREERFWVHAWSYRDWVVRALNEDMPYDRFLLLQLAADQVAADDPPSQAAMGFLTLGRRYLGVTHDIIDDRIDVVTRGPAGADRGLRPLPRPQVRPDPDRGLLLALRDLPQLLRAAGPRGEVDRRRPGGRGVRAEACRSG